MKLLVTILSIFSLTASAAPNRKVDAGVLEFKQQAAPANPATGYNRFYVKADGKFYHLNALGVEVEVGAGGGGGAKNYIQNPNAATDATTGVTYTNVTAGRDSSGGLFEDTNFSFTIDSATDVVSFAADAFDPYLQNTGLCQAEFTWTADANGENVQAQVFRNGAVIGQKNLYTTGATSPATASIAFLCGDLVNATTFRIVGTAATATALKLSQVKLTEAQWSKDPVGGTFVGSVTWPGVSSCNWNQVPAVGTWSGFAVNSSCTFPTGSNVKGSGVAAPATKKPAVKILNAVAGQTYDIDVSGFFYNAASSQYCSYRLSDGTDHSLLINSFGSSSGTETAVPFMKGQITFSSSGDKEVEIQATAYNGTPTCYVYADGINTASLTLAVKSYPNNQAVVNLKAQSGDYDALAYSPTITGLGAITDAAFTHERKKGVLTVKGTFTTVTPTGVYATISLPGSLQLPVTVNGRSNLESALGPDVGRYRTNVANQIGNILTATGTSRSVVYFGDTTNVSGGLTPRFGSTFAGSGVLYSVEFTVPIQGWTKSNTAVNIAGEPGAFNAYHDSDCAWTMSSGGSGDPSPDASCTFTSRLNANFGTVTRAESGGSALPGLVFTPKVTGNYSVCSTFGGVQADSLGYLKAKLLANGTEISGTGITYNSNTNTITQCAAVSATAGTALTIKWTLAAIGSNVSLNNGIPDRAIDWTIFPITQNLPGLLGGAGLVKRHWKGYFDKDCDSWTKATGLASDFSDDASCTFIQQKNQGMGTVTHTGAKTPGVTWTSTETGTIEVCLTASGFTSGANNVSRWEIYDGATSFDQVNTYGNNQYYPMKMCGIKDTTAGATETWKLRCEAPATGSCSVNPAGSTNGSWTTFTIRYL